ncbi:MAG: flavin reductase family protein [Planctomycetota bacterium]
MQIRPEEESASRIYSLMIRAIAPRPIAWVSTISDDGMPNLAPFSYFNGVCSDPAALVFSVVNHVDGRKKDTARNIESNGQFVVNTVPFELREQMVRCAGDYEYEQDEFEIANVPTEPSVAVRPPRVRQAPVKFECELMQIVNIGEGPLAANLVIGRILLIDVSDDILDENGKIDPARSDLIGRMGGRSYATTRDRFDIKLD